MLLILLSLVSSIHLLNAESSETKHVFELQKCTDALFNCNGTSLEEIASIVAK